MPEQEKAHGHNNTATDEKNATEPPKGLLRWTLIGGAIGFLILILVSVYHPYLTERVKFLVGSSVSLFVLLAVIVQAVIYRGQWKAMNEQAGVMKEGLEETRNLLRQNEWAFKENHRQANAARAQMQEQSEAMKGQLDAMERQLKATERAAESAYIAQRAYIGITDLRLETTGMIFSAQLVVGQTPTLFVRWHNGGKTPARNFRAAPYLVFGEKPERKGYLLGDDMSDIEASFIPTGKEVTMPYPQDEFGFKPVTKEMLDDLNSGKKRLYAMILVSYVDFTGKDRWLESAALYKPDEGTFTELDEYYSEK